MGYIWTGKFITFANLFCRVIIMWLTQQKPKQHGPKLNTILLPVYRDTHVYPSIGLSGEHFVYPPISWLNWNNGTNGGNWLGGRGLGLLPLLTGWSCGLLMWQRPLCRHLLALRCPISIFCHLPPTPSVSCFDIRKYAKINMKIRY